MKKLPAIFLLGLLSLAALGCALARTYQARVNGYTHTPGPLLAPGDSLLVIEDQTATDPLLEKEIKASPLIDPEKTKLIHGPDADPSGDTFSFGLSLALKRPIKL